MKNHTLMNREASGILIMAGILFLNSACSPIVEKMIGMRKVREIRPLEYRRLLHRLEANTDNAFVLDTNYFEEVMSDSGIFGYGSVKRHCQPIQALYYGHRQHPQAWFINCNAPGFPNLDWNRGGLFDTFPPRTAAEPDSLLPYERLSSILQTPHNLHKPLPAVGPEQPYTVVFYWNRMLFRQSLRLYRHLKENLSMQKGPARIIYINNDRLFSEMERQ